MTKFTINTAIYDGKQSTILSLPGDMMTGKYARRRFYEEDLLVAIAQRKLAGTYIDVGANIGNHTVFFAEHCPSTRVIAIEPRPDIFEVLKLNVAGTPAAWKVQTLCCAAGAAEGTGRLIQRVDGNAGSTAVTDMDVGNVDIAIRPLDMLVAYTDVAVVKIDVEGYEELVLDGAVRLLEQRPLLAIECQTEQQLAAVTGKLTPLGYSCSGKY